MRSVLQLEIWYCQEQLHQENEGHSILDALDSCSSETFEYIYKLFSL